MRAIEITTPMPLLDEGEKQAVKAHVDQAIQFHRQKQYPAAAEHFTAAAKLGHPLAQCVLAAYYAAGCGVPRDRRMAFQLYLEAARHGNVVAQYRTGECYLAGEGVEADGETGLAWLEAAGQRGDVDACRRLAQLYGGDRFPDGEKAAFWRARAEEIARKAEKPPTRSGGDETPPRRPTPAMPPLGPAAANYQRTELYRNGYSRRKDVGNCGDTLYYLCKGQDGRVKLWASRRQGGERTELADVDDYADAYLAATSVSVFLYRPDQDKRGNTVLRVREVALDGGLDREFQLEADYRTVHSVYVYVSSLFYALHKDGKCWLCVYYAETGTRSVLYRKASDITDIYADADCVVFHARYERDGQYESGWMLYDIPSGQVSCLDCSLSPENLVDHPQYYQEDSPSYVEDVRRREIAFFDLARGILWLERAQAGENALVLEAHSLRDQGHPRRPEIPTWRLDREWWSRMRGGLVYFDGERMYCAPDYYHFWGCGRDGTVYPWDLHNNGHGCCDRFFVFGDLLLLNGDTFGEKVYRAVPEPTPPLGTSWRESAPAAADFRPAPEEKPTDGKPDLETIKTLTATDVKYGILTFGAKLDVGAGRPVTVTLRGARYSAKMHNSAKGRVDGLRKLFAEQGLQEGDLVRASYRAREGVIQLDPIEIE